MKVPNFFLPNVLKNHGNYIISLSNLCKWLGEFAENLGVEIFPGFAASKLLYDNEQKVIGVQTGDMGIDKITLVNVASHKLKKQKLDESLMYLYHLALYYETRYCWRSNRDPFAYGICTDSGLS